MNAQSSVTSGSPYSAIHDVPASSSGLCHDGWLEANNRLVLKLNESVRELRIGIYLPETGEVDGEAAVELELGEGKKALIRGRMTLKRGLNQRALKLPQGIGMLATFALRSFYRYRPESNADRRQLIAVLVELKTG